MTFNLLNLRLKIFNLALVSSAIFVVIFIIYEIIVLNSIQKELTKTSSDQFLMLQASDRLRQSSDDLTHFARSYAVTENVEFEKRYLDTLKIRNGKKARPIGYNGIYWDLDKSIRELRHPKGEKKSLNTIIEELPFSEIERKLLQKSQKNSTDLVNIEVESFVAIKKNNYKKAVLLLHSKEYYKAKHNIMLPLDEMLTLLEKRTQDKITSLENSVNSQFYYLFLGTIIFIFGSIITYYLINKKINRPIEYLTLAIKKFQNDELSVEKKHFYHDEVGYMIEEFFSMKESIINQKNILTHLNENLTEVVAQRVHEIDQKNVELKRLLSSFDRNVIYSQTDLKGVITHVSEAFCAISGYKKEELMGKQHGFVRHPDMSSEIFKELWVALKQETCIEMEIKNLKKNGDFYWINAKFEPEYDADGVHIGYSALREEITAQKELEELSLNLESKIVQKTKDLTREKKFIQTLLDSQEQLIITTDGDKIISANETFLDFFAIDTVADFKEEYGAECICNTFDTHAPEGYLQGTMGSEKWIDYVISRSFSEIHKVVIKRGNSEYIFSVSGATLPSDVGLARKSAIFTDITELEIAKRDTETAKAEIESIHKRTKESIEYAALIQSALIPDNSVAKEYFKDYFAVWHPKDMVGGDIYLFEELRDKDECILMVIDCTGHGVPGAFVTMLVKAIERSIVSKINHSDEIVSPANLLKVFNSSIKHILKQNDEHSISNAGFDGQIMYFNKKENILKVASARNDIFYFQEDELHVIKGDRQSIGYKDSDLNFKFTEHTIDITKDTTLYLLTDGYWDQIGGEKGLPFGKKRLKKLLTEIYKEKMSDQQEEFLYRMQEYVKEEEILDDTTIVGIKI